MGIYGRSGQRGGRKVGWGKRETGGEKEGERKCKEAKVK